MAQLKTLQDQMKSAGMQYTPRRFLTLCTIPSAVFAINISLLLFFMLKASGKQWIAFICLPVLFGLFMLICTQIPKANAERLGRKIESDILVPGTMLVTLLESGNSVVRAFERAGATNTVSGKYFGKIAAEIYLGKNLEEAIDEAMRYNPSASFRRVLEPVKNSLRTGTAIEKNLLATLEDLTQEKIVEIERYEKRLGPASMFYMIFGTIVPAVGIVGSVIILSILGLDVTFFPILFVLLILITIMQLLFLEMFKAIRPLVKL